MRNDQCQEGGCGLSGGIRCNYVDRRSRACTTTWCSDHWVLAGGRPYCRRHAGVVEAIADEHATTGWPDVDNRAASLVGWVARDLDRSVRDILIHAAPDTGATLVVDPVRLVHTPGGGSRLWQRAWKLVDHAGMLNKVAIEVDESDDAVVSARVDTELIGQGMPPWIERRRQGVAVTPEVDAAERRSFNDAMTRSIELVITRQEMVPHY